MRVPSLRDVFNLVTYIFSTFADIVVLYLYRLIILVIGAIVVLYLYHLISQVIGCRRRLMDTVALGLIVTYVGATTTVDHFADPYMRTSRFRLDIPIYLILIFVSRFFFIEQVLTLLTRNRRVAELTGMKRMVTSSSLTICCYLCVMTLWCQYLAGFYRSCVMVGWNTFLLLLLRMLALFLSVECFNTPRNYWGEVVSLLSTKQTEVKRS